MSEKPFKPGLMEFDSQELQILIWSLDTYLAVGADCLANKPGMSYSDRRHMLDLVGRSEMVRDKLEVMRAAGPVQRAPVVPIRPGVA